MEGARSPSRNGDEEATLTSAWSAPRVAEIVEVPMLQQMPHPIPRRDIHSLEVAGQTVSYVGPDKSAGALPALFYFSISGHDSLGLDPFNQPAAFLEGSALRVFSFDLPGHGPGQDKTEGVSWYAQQLREGRNPLFDFIESARAVLDKLIADGWIDAERVGAAGLSRGMFYAGHWAAQDTRLKILLGYAPMTQLTPMKQFASLAGAADLDALGLHQLADQLCTRRIRFYIGHSDSAVSTDVCYATYQAFVQAAAARKIRSAPIEMIILPSIGHRGHGSSPTTFYAGAQWMAAELTQ